LQERDKEASMIQFKLRFFMLPAMALAVLGMLYAPTDGGRSAPVCGTALRIVDPDILASFEAFQRTQSPAAARICRIASNNQP
jgi:hypothetical protein